MLVANGWSLQPGKRHQIANDFGISEPCLRRWARRAEIEDDVRECLTPAEEAEIRALKKRNRLLEQENEVFRRPAIYLGQGINPKVTYPLVRDLAADTWRFAERQGRTRRQSPDPGGREHPLRDGHGHHHQSNPAVSILALGNDPKAKLWFRRGE